ncbi:uncharacterized protein BDZ99DRAFT_40471 [Mytilinidion resinicola]|uniref:Uncharacterized protein n=1 Tax=Mytilinidion resinicola TaxID=574789 RepID=A0A6A6YJU7_9PEZI|nr:uncharacterized protein BDZ99DRAFT_40471 [Mytilinidion resinicola]KAF2808828.1 hypothetical protein BDZ99DRAFT_40471 [Mytilinidion resinicola]
MSGQSQLESRLLLAPYDIRRAIYVHLIPDRVHVVLREGKIHISACVQQTPGFDYDGLERQVPGDDRDEPVYARRLRSWWGPHWKCEEVAASVEHNYEAVFHVCKRMSIDVFDFMAEMTVFNITDLDTLSYTLQEVNASASEPSPASMLLACLFPSIRKMDITLRLPLSVCEAPKSPAIESSSASLSAEAPTSNATA